MLLINGLLIDKANYASIYQIIDPLYTHWHQNLMVFTYYVINETHVCRVTWFAIRDHFWWNICDMICDKGLLLKYLNKHLCILTVTIYVTVYIKNWGVLTVVPFHKSGYNCFDRSGPLLQICFYLVYTNIDNFSLY